MFFGSQKAFLPAIVFALHTRLIMLPYLFRDSLIQRSKIKESAVTQFSVNTGIKHLYLILYQPFVFGVFCPGRNNSHPIVVAKVFHGSVALRLIAIRFGNSCF